MTHGTDPDADNWREVGIPHRTIAWTALRVAASIAVVAALYYLLPFDRSSTAVVVAILVIGLAVFVAPVGFQVRAIIRAPFPGLRATEALATSVPLFLALFAGSYFVIPRLAPAASAYR